MRWIIDIVRAVLSLALLAAGTQKLFDPALFAQQVHDFRLTPWWMSAAIATWLPWLEILTALGVWIKRVAGGAWLLYLTMLLGFIAALTTALARGLDVDCGCFGGVGGGSDLWFGISRNLLLLTGACWCILHEHKCGR